jgi:predicted nucleic acid-binding protein
MKIFSTVLIPEAKKGMEYVVTAQVDNVNPEMDSREGPYYFIQEVRKGAAKKIKKANFKQGKFYNHADVILA